MRKTATISGGKENERPLTGQTTAEKKREKEEIKQFVKLT